MFYENDIPSVSTEWIKILEQQGQSKPTDKEVWEMVRCNPEPPHIGNAWMYLVLSQIQQWCTERQVDCDYYVNAVDSHLYVNGEEVYDFEQYVRTIALAQPDI